ncbi:hypothetical protein ROW34_09910 [Pseudomonas soli]|uniref:hypothetical protein n=1 Tax=Pseudomonas soli TaxID=1306993 RepID=UPI001E409998|nr:hypothetical protein [Pseudomonas soli]MDT3714241.1 hypothetical protein [Pseudomonas soli]MDT3730959.1 hypothetical protein [Pseudomonas soli]WJO23028.1 hypothetical protein LU688_05380 [Pseudomonas soli]
MPFAKRGDVVHSEATSGFNNQKKSLLINGLAALGDSLHPLHLAFPARRSIDVVAVKRSLGSFFRFQRAFVDLAHSHRRANWLEYTAVRGA